MHAVCVSVCVYSGLCVCSVLAFTFWLSEMSAPTLLSCSPCKSVRYFHSSVSVLIFALISCLDAEAPLRRPAHTAHCRSAMFSAETKIAHSKNIRISAAFIFIYQTLVRAACDV